MIEKNFIEFFEKRMQILRYRNTSINTYKKHRKQVFT